MHSGYSPGHRHGHGCGCHCGPPMRVCCREPKELLVQDTGEQKASGDTLSNVAKTGISSNEVLAIGQLASNEGRTVIGGGCCVSLSIEYMPSNFSLASTQIAAVEVLVQDSGGTVLAWERQFKQGYHIQECIITTNPGAILLVRVNNAIARVRWCEVFSC